MDRRDLKGILWLLGRPLVWVILGLLLIAGLFEWWHERRKQQRFDLQIQRVARQYGVDPFLVKAVVWRESRFDPNARGRAGELGLMQIGALAAKEWAQAETRKLSFEGNLLDPDTNLRVGTWYLGKLIKRYERTDDPVVYGLADYNAGRSNVLRWNKGAAETNSALFLEEMTFPGTREYIRSILHKSANYRQHQHCPSDQFLKH
jgi:soluble lytic murein transglycosylase